MKLKNIPQPKSIAFVLIFIITAIACTDNFFDSQNTTTKNDLTIANSASVIPNVALPDPYADSVLRPTVLGIHLPNPYLLTNMKQAYKNVTGSNAGVAVTHLLRSISANNGKPTGYSAGDFGFRPL